MAKPGYRVFETTVVEVRPLTPHFVRVTFGSDDLRAIGWDGPDQRIKVVLPLEGDRGEAGAVDADPYAHFPRTGDDWFGEWRALPDATRNPIRTYTIREARPASGELDIDFVAHGDSGPASRWIARAVAGDRMLLIAPDATSDAPAGGWEWHPGDARTLLVAGDETAVPAISVILGQLPPDARGAAFLEVPARADRLDLHAPAGVEVHWIERGDDGGSDASPLDGAPGYGARLVDAVTVWADRRLGGDAAAGASALPEIDDDEILWEVPEGTSDGGFYAWLAGEAGAITTLRRHLVKELGVDRRRVAFMGYWKLGRAEG